MRLCSKCKYGEINFWGYDECWKFNQQPDFDRTTNTAMRELHAKNHNKSLNCIHYEPESVFQRVKELLRIN